MKKNIRLRLLSFSVITYMLMAFAWWSILLFKKNREAFLAKRDLLKNTMVAEGTIRNDEQFLRSGDYQELVRERKRQEWMIFGEAGVFVFSLAIGVWLINRGYHEEVMAARQRRNFLLSITHELKSPIASIQLVLETLLKRRLKKEQLDRLSSSALIETERLNTLVNDLLLSAKLETAYVPNLDKIDLAALFREIIQKLTDKYPHARISFRRLSDIPIITGDVLGFTSVALNLLENAIKYSREDPDIVVSLKREGQQIEIEVADQGIGVDDKEKKKIFGKFYRSGNEDTRQTKGTGLGLYIVNQIIKTHHGTITVLDNQPRGTIFRIELPMNEN